MDDRERPTQAPSKTILVAEDDLALRDFFAHALALAGFGIITAADAEEAIARLPERPDAIVLDLVMPGGGGLGVLASLAPADSAPPVLLVTGCPNRDSDLSEAVLNPAVVRVLGKPISADTLIETLRRLLD